MSTKVFKFGGSLLNTIDGFKQINKIIELYLADQLASQLMLTASNNLIIVVSAFGKTTSKLLKAATIAEINGEVSAMPAINDIIGYHISIVDALIKNKNRNAESKSYIQEQHTKLVNYIKGISLTRELSPRTKDLVLSIGEMLASNIVSKYLLEYFPKVMHFDITSVLRTNNNYGSAIPDIESTRENINSGLLPLFKHCNIIITQGFIGSTIDDEITTMGYESSNLTAAILAGLTNADEFIIWTDVEGIRQYDPKLVNDKTPELIKKINYDFAEYLGYSGLKLIYPGMIELLRQFNLEVIYKSGFKPEGEYTTIGTEGDIANENIIINFRNLITYSKSNIVNRFNEDCFPPMSHFLQYPSNIVLISPVEHLFISNEINIPIYVEEDLFNIHFQKSTNINLLLLINFEFSYFMKTMDKVEKIVRDQMINVFVTYQRKSVIIVYKDNEDNIVEDALAKHFIHNFLSLKENNV